MKGFNLPTGIEIKQNQPLDNTIKIQIPNTRFWIIGEKKESKLWDVFMIDPRTNRKEILRKNAKTSSFAAFSNIILKTPFPIGKQEVGYSNIKSLIITLTKKSIWKQK